MHSFHRKNGWAARFIFGTSIAPRKPNHKKVAGRLPRNRQSDWNGLRKLK
jgi:hypothetical protein